MGARLERRIDKEIVAMKGARHLTEYAQHIRHYARLQERYCKQHHTYYQPTATHNGVWEGYHLHD